MSTEPLRDDTPLLRGWYATLHCWEVREGMFPGAHYWDGERWQPETKAWIQYWPIVFKAESEARQYADEHDPGY